MCIYVYEKIDICSMLAHVWLTKTLATPLQSLSTKVNAKDFPLEQFVRNFAAKQDEKVS